MISSRLCIISFVRDCSRKKLMKVVSHCFPKIVVPYLWPTTCGLLTSTAICKSYIANNVGSCISCLELRVPLKNNLRIFMLFFYMCCPLNIFLVHLIQDNHVYFCMYCFKFFLGFLTVVKHNDLVNRVGVVAQFCDLWYFKSTNRSLYI